MKKIVLGLACGLFFSSNVMAEQGSIDVIINSNNLQYSPDLTQITLDQPQITLKEETGKLSGKPIPLDEFATFWSPKNDSEADFEVTNPNATLSAWDSNKRYLESSFVITNVENQNGKLTLSVKGLDKGQAAAPVLINSKAANNDQLQNFVTSTEHASVTILIDCAGGLDGRCGHHRR